MDRFNDIIWLVFMMSWIAVVILGLVIKIKETITEKKKIEEQKIKTEFRKEIDERSQRHEILCLDVKIDDIEERLKDLEKKQIK